jgi:hypothetical protein
LITFSIFIADLSVCTSHAGSIESKSGSNKILKRARASNTISAAVVRKNEPAREDIARKPRSSGKLSQDLDFAVSWFMSMSSAFNILLVSSTLMSARMPHATANCDLLQPIIGSSLRRDEVEPLCDEVALSPLVNDPIGAKFESMPKAFVGLVALSGDLRENAPSS